MASKQYLRIWALVMTFAFLCAPLAPAAKAMPVTVEGSDQPVVQHSNRLIVELDSPPLAAAYRNSVSAAAVNGKLDANVPAAQAYINQLQAEQATFVSTMQATVAGATVANFVNESGLSEQATYQVVFNGLAVDVGANDRAQTLVQLAKLPGVKNVYLDQPYYTQLYTSTHLINAPALWNQVGGQAGGGAGIKFASMDGGVHHAAPMMDGTGYNYPPGYGPNGLGLTANNNGKIIASRAYFRPWDPPAPGDENPWPGVAGTSHGMHTASTAAGDIVTATYNGLNLGTISGVAPHAYVMSYRVFYESLNADGSFYTTEGLAALEDIVRDGADVVNNSWGGGPGSSGGINDPLDQALINAVNAGIFVSMSNGNAGPGSGTSDHPSADYINVAATTSGGALASGVLNVIAPTPTDPNLQQIPYGTADFGPGLPVAQTSTYDVAWAGTVAPTNVRGCNAFPANAFTGVAALISRGDCNFSDKVFNAQQAGATFVVIYDNSSDIVQGMSCASHCEPGEITINAIRIPMNAGNAVVSWVQTHGAATKLEVNTIAFQQGNTPDQIIGFSSRGPGVGGTLKPDIAAPGVNIIAQGYTEGVSGEARHLGYGQASGTSMASPHVAGAAVLLKQIHPNWSPAWIKSALMSTAKYMDIYLDDGTTPAQPLDMGAGRLDLTRAANPGVILDPPSLSFGYLISGTQKTITVTVTSVATGTETYNLSTLYTGDGFTQTTALPGYNVTPAAVTLAAGESKTVQVTFNSLAGMGQGDTQGYIIMDGTTHDAHLAAWARVTPALPLADVLIIDNDFSDELEAPDYRWYYTNALEALDYSYAVVSTADGVGSPTTIPDAATLAGYRAILYFTGDNYQGNGTFSVSTGLTDQDMDRLTEYLNNGGTVIAMGQDLAAVLNADDMDSDTTHFFYTYRLGANWIQDSVSDGLVPDAYIVETEEAPPVLENVTVDLTKPRALQAAGVLSGTQEVPPVNTLATGEFTLYHDIDRAYTEFEVTVTPSTTQPITVTGMHIHVGDAGVNGPVIVDLAAMAGITLPVYVTDSLTVAGVISPSLTMTQVQQMATDGTYINVHSTTNPSGLIRGQIEPVATNSQRYIDEVDNRFHNGKQDPTGMDILHSIPLLKYQGPYNRFAGTVALGHRQQPSLENPGITYPGRSVYATFGLEGMSNDFSVALNITPTTRSELLGAFLDWGWSQPPTTVAISDTVAMSSTLYTFTATAAYGVQASTGSGTGPTPKEYRWDFGDGSPYLNSITATASHTYLCSETNSYTVRVEITDTFGNVVIGSQMIDVSDNCSTNAGPDQILFLPIIAN